MSRWLFELCRKNVTFRPLKKSLAKYSPKSIGEFVERIQKYISMEENLGPNTSKADRATQDDNASRRFGNKQNKRFFGSNNPEVIRNSGSRRLKILRHISKSL